MCCCAILVKCRKPYPNTALRICVTCIWTKHPEDLVLGINLNVFGGLKRLDDGNAGEKK